MTSTPHEHTNMETPELEPFTPLDDNLSQMSDHLIAKNMPPVAWCLTLDPATGIPLSMVDDLSPSTSETRIYTNFENADTTQENEVGFYQHPPEQPPTYVIDPSRIVTSTRPLFPLDKAATTIIGGSVIETQATGQKETHLTESPQESIEFIKDYLNYKYGGAWTIGQLKTVCKQFFVEESYIAISDALCE